MQTFFSFCSLKFYQETKAGVSGMQVAFVFQTLNGPLCPQFWHSLAGTVGQTKLHKTDTSDKNLDTNTIQWGKEKVGPGEGKVALTWIHYHV